MKENPLLGPVILRCLSPNLTPCGCGRIVWLVLRAELFCDIWRAECDCGLMTLRCFQKKQAEARWEEMQLDDAS